MNERPSLSPGTNLVAPPTVSDLELSCRLPLLVLFISAAVWFFIGSLCALLVSIKFHAPAFLAEPAWLTYGRLRPAGFDAFLYGGCLQAGLGVGIWLLADLGRTLAPRLALTWGAAFWNFAVTIGFLGVLAGDSTGFAGLEMPAYSAVPLFVGYVLLGVFSVLLFHRRRDPVAFPSQWLLLAALFWFPWIYSTAELLLVAYPVRGVAQAVIDWWYSNNLSVVWLTLVGFAAVFYMVARHARRPLHSHYLALIVFWLMLLFVSWAGIPNSAPVPVWMPTASTIATVLLVIPIIALALNVHGTLAGNYAVLRGNAPLQFVLFGVAAFVAANLMRVCGTLADSGQELHFTWFTVATRQLHVYGFFAMVMFGAVYEILPRIMGLAFVWPRLVRLHFGLAAAGIVLLVVPLGIAGVVQDFQLLNPSVPFLDISRNSLAFLRVSTIGDLLLAISQFLFLGNLLALVAQFYRVRTKAAYMLVTADLFKPAGAKV